MVIIAANQDTIFARLTVAIGQPDLKDDPKYASHVARGENQIELDALIGAWAQDKTIADIESLMIAQAVTVGKVYRPEDMLADPHYAARESIIEVPSDHFEKVKM